MSRVRAPSIALLSPLHFMTVWQAFLLGLVQGVTEFLPVSSSGHLALGQYFLGADSLKDHSLFQLICHLGTLIAIIFVFFPSIKASLNLYSKSFWQVLLGTLPLIPLVLMLKPLKSFFNDPQVLGPCFLLSSALLFASSYYRFPLRSQAEPHPWRDSFTIGLFQAIAILPGVSRSGATISAARLLGWQSHHAFIFSFLLAIPAIVGGLMLEGWQLWQTSSASTIDSPAFLMGFFTAAGVGYFSLKVLMPLILQEKWSYFAWYCLLLGLATTFYFNGELYATSPQNSKEKSLSIDSLDHL